MSELLKINIKPIVDDESNKTKAKKTLDKFFKAPYIKKFSPIMKNMLGMDSAYGKHSSMVTPNSSMAAMARSNTAYASPNYMGFDRRSALGEYSSMVLTNSVIQAATDILADDSSVKFVTGDTIQVLTEDNTIKEELDHLFFDVLNVNFNLRDWIRDMIVFGDNFLLLDLTLYEGVCGALPLNIYEVERVEDLMDLENPVKFILNNQADRVFNVWEVAHFRMLGDKQFSPYGSCLRGDTLISMADNTVKYIKDITKNDVVKTFDIKTEKFVDSKVLDTICSGKKKIYSIRAKNYILNASGEHNIMVFDKVNSTFNYKKAEELNIKDILVVKNNNTDNGKSVFIDKTMHDMDINNINNASGWKSKFDLIPDIVDEEFARVFGFLLGDGWIIKRNNNHVSFAMGIYPLLNKKYHDILKKYTGKDGKIAGGKNGASKSYVFGSRALATVLQNMGFDGYAKTKNIPDWIFTCSDSIKKAFIDGLVDADGTLVIDKWNCLRLTVEMANKNIIYRLKALLQSMNYKCGKILYRKRDMRNKTIKGNKLKCDFTETYVLNFYESKCKQIQMYDNVNRLSDEYILCPIEKIEILDEDYVYDIYVENENHNFIANNIVVHNSVLEPVRRYYRQMLMIEDAIMIHQIVRAPERRIVYLDVAGLPPESVEDYVNDMANTMKNSTVDMNNDNNLDWKLDPMNMLDDYIIPVRGKDSATKIETLQGAKYEMSLDSVKYIQRNLVTSLKVPKRYLGLDGDSDGKSDLKNAAAQEDIRFSRTIERIQSMVITVLKQIGVTHLILKGYSDSQVDCFNIQMKNPSSASEIEKLEVIKQKFGMAADILEGKLASRRWVYENILNFTKEDIEIIRVELFDDYNFMAKVDAVSNVWLKKFTQEYEKAYNVQTPQDAMGGGAGQQPGEDNKNIAEEFRKKSIGGDNNVGSRLMSPGQSSPILRPYEGKLAKFDKIDKNNTVVNNRLLNEGMFTKFLETNDKLLEEAEEFLNNNPDIDLVELTK